MQSLTGIRQMYVVSSSILGFADSQQTILNVWTLAAWCYLTHIQTHSRQVQVAVYHRGLGLVRLFLYALVVAYAATQMTVFHKFAVFENPTSTVQIWLDRNGTGYARSDPMARPYCAPAYFEKLRCFVPGGYNFTEFSCALRDMSQLQAIAPNEVTVATAYGALFSSYFELVTGGWFVRGSIWHFSCFYARTIITNVNKIQQPRRTYETKMYRGTQIGDSHTTLYSDAEISTFNFALGYSVSWHSRCVHVFVIENQS